MLSLRNIFAKKKEDADTHHFIHIPKNGGIAVRAALGKRPEVSMSDPFHFRYRDIVHEVGAQQNFFCLIRNPWSRTVSRFFYAKQQAAKWPADDPRRLYIESIDFEAFVREKRIVDALKFKGQPWMGPTFSWLNQTEWLVDEAGEVRVSCLRYEHMKLDLSLYFEDAIDVKPVNVTSGSKDYRTMYSASLADDIASYFQRDIEYFGFDFDSPATQNTVAG